MGFQGLGGEGLSRHKLLLHSVGSGGRGQVLQDPTQAPIKRFSVWHRGKCELSFCVRCHQPRAREGQGAGARCSGRLGTGGAEMSRGEVSRARRTGKASRGVNIPAAGLEERKSPGEGSVYRRVRDEAKLLALRSRGQASWRSSNAQGGGEGSPIYHNLPQPFGQSWLCHTTSFITKLIIFTSTSTGYPKQTVNL